MLRKLSGPTSKGSVAINGAQASRVMGFSVGRNIVLTCTDKKMNTTLTLKHKIIKQGGI